MTPRSSWLVLGILVLSGAAGLACAGPSPAQSPATGVPATAGPPVRCRTVLEVRPGAYGAAIQTTPVERCEPQMPISAPEDDEKPLGTP